MLSEVLTYFVLHYKYDNEVQKKLLKIQWKDF